MIRFLYIVCDSDVDVGVQGNCTYDRSYPVNLGDALTEKIPPRVNIQAPPRSLTTYHHAQVC